jgi:hypothetical protein
MEIGGIEYKTNNGYLRTFGDLSGRVLRVTARIEASRFKTDNEYGEDCPEGVTQDMAHRWFCREGDAPARQLQSEREW